MTYYDKMKGLNFDEFSSIITGIVMTATINAMQAMGADVKYSDEQYRSIKENIKALLQTEEGGLDEQGIDSPTTD